MLIGEIAHQYGVYLTFCRSFATTTSATAALRPDCKKLAGVPKPAHKYLRANGSTVRPTLDRPCQSWLRI
jgi:hypothetical protein